MSTDKTGGSAFPSNVDLFKSGDFREGMTLLDYFAGQALQGLSANTHRLQNMEDTGVSAETAKHYSAVHAYEMADAMLVERQKRMAGNG